MLPAGLMWSVVTLSPTTHRARAPVSGLIGAGLGLRFWKNGGSWMPVLEPLTDPVPNYRVLGYDSSILWMD